MIKPAQFDAEIIKVRVFGVPGTFDLFYYDSDNYLKIATTTIGASAATLKDNLYNLPNLGGYDPTVTV